MNKVIKISFAKQKSTVTALYMILFMLFFMVSGCENEEKERFAIGIIVGSYYNGWASLFVEVDKKYRIGENIGYVEKTERGCWYYANEGTYRNLIQVQTDLALTARLENETSDETYINKKIVFSYRSYRKGEDSDLFNLGFGNAVCGYPDFPIYVITKCQILENTP